MLKPRVPGPRSIACTVKSPGGKRCRAEKINISMSALSVGKFFGSLAHETFIENREDQELGAR